MRVHCGRLSLKLVLLVSFLQIRGMHYLPSSLLLKSKIFSCCHQEALEVRRPQFISRSQERLKKLEHMVQQRKAQRKENLGQKQSLFPVRANKKQFTVPHPLSGKPPPQGGLGGQVRLGGECLRGWDLHPRRWYRYHPDMRQTWVTTRIRILVSQSLPQKPAVVGAYRGH